MPQVHPQSIIGGSKGTKFLLPPLNFKEKKAIKKEFTMQHTNGLKTQNEPQFPVLSTQNILCFHYCYHYPLLNNVLRSSGIEESGA